MGCSMVVFAMIGTLDIVVGILAALFVGLALWFLLANLGDIEERRR